MSILNKKEITVKVGERGVKNTHTSPYHKPLLSKLYKAGGSNLKVIKVINALILIYKTHADTFVIMYAKVVIQQASEARGSFDKGAVGTAWQSWMERMKAVSLRVYFN